MTPVTAIFKAERSDHSFMGNHKRKTSKRGHGGRFQAIRFNAQTALSTLADAALIQTTLTSLAQEFFAISADISAAFRGATLGEGPIQFGFNHGDLSTAEVQECLDAAITSEGDIVAKERLRRPVRRVGRVAQMNTTQGGGLWNNGNTKRIQLRFNLAANQEVEGWVRNQSGATLTTGAIIEWQGSIYGYWR